MPYTLHFDQAKKIVQVFYAGTVSLIERMQAVEDVCGRYTDLNPLKILVDVRALEMHLSFEEQQLFGKFLANHPGLSNARVAVCHKSGHNPNIIIDTLAFTQGYMLAQFDKKRDAESWLSKAAGA
jgi:hypothetical protein